MKTTVFCKITSKGTHTFYLISEGKRYFLFNQKYRKGVQEYYGRGILLNEAVNYSKTHKDSAVIKTMSKIPMYVKYIEKEYDIRVFEKSKKNYCTKCKSRNFKCA